MKLLSALLLIGALACDAAAAEKAKLATRALTSIPGLTEITEARLNAAGINNVNDLLMEGATPQGREEIATRSGLSAAQILKFVNYADLFRINGLDAHVAGLLQAAEVDTVPELARRTASGLHAKLQEVNSAKKARVPTETQVAEWIEAAKTLPKMVTD